MPPKGKGKPRAYKLATIDAEGLTVKDIFKKDWKVGAPVGTGGFGRLYQATDVSNGTGSAYVIKIEPLENGPLFSELSFYQRKAKQTLIDDFKRPRKLMKLGMPLYISSGRHEQAGSVYRFMVMPQYKVDLQKLFVQSNKKFPVKTVINIALQVLDVLEYMHTNDYVHADIKAANLLLDLKDSNQVYLVDFGLAAKYRNDGKHCDYKPDPRKAHDGTIEFTSLDAHRGCSPSRRGDLEILGYCCLQWLCSELPWEKNLTQPDKVFALKQQFMDKLPGSIKILSKDIPQCLSSYMTSVSGLEYEEEPDYSLLRKSLRDGMKKEKISLDGKLEFPKAVSSQPGTSKKRKSSAHSAECTPKRKPSLKSKSADKRGKSPAAKKVVTPRKTASNGKASTSRATSSKASTSKAAATAYRGDDTSSTDSTSSKSRNRNNSAAVNRRKSLNPQALKVLKKAKTTATSKVAGKKQALPSRPTSKVTSAMHHAISPQTAMAMKKAKADAAALVAKSPRLAKVKATIATQTSPGLQGLKGRRKESKR